MLPTVAQILLYKTLPWVKPQLCPGPAKSHNKVRLSGGRGCSREGARKRACSAQNCGGRKDPRPGRGKKRQALHRWYRNKTDLQYTRFLVLSMREKLLNPITGQPRIRVEGTYPRLRLGLAETVQGTMSLVPVCTVPTRGERRRGRRQEETHGLSQAANIKSALASSQALKSHPRQLSKSKQA